MLSIHPYHISLVSFQSNPKNLDQSYKTEFLGTVLVKKVLYNSQITQSQINAAPFGIVYPSTVMSLAVECGTAIAEGDASRRVSNTTAPGNKDNGEMKMYAMLDEFMFKNCTEVLTS